MESRDQPDWDLNDEQRARLLLAQTEGIGPRRLQALLAHFQTAEAVLRAGRGRLQQVAGVGTQLARLVASQTSAQVDAILDECRHCDARPLFRESSDYPWLLNQIHDPPEVLFVQGTIRDWHPAIAIVGTRQATAYGRQQARSLAAELCGRGYVVVSGLARGIDAAAHLAVVEAAGRTIAVLGSGVANLYPPEHGGLARRIRQRGLVISEAPPGRPAVSGAFPQRNRIIAGLSLGIVVVEAAQRSGALITVRHALDQGREVFAVPGQVDNAVARGCHQILREGACLVENVDDILQVVESLSLASPVPPQRNVSPVSRAATADALATSAAPRSGSTTPHHKNIPELEGDAAQLWKHLESAPIDIDELALRSELPMHRVLVVLHQLESQRCLIRDSGRLVRRA